MGKYLARLITAIILVIAPLLANCSEYERVSIIALIGQPDKYEGKEVRVTGYLEIKHEGDALYLTEEHADKVLTANAIWLSLTEEQVKEWKSISREYVTVYGTFASERKGHLSLFPGSLVDISIINERPDFEKLRSDRKRIQKEFENKN